MGFAIALVIPTSACRPSSRPAIPPEPVRLTVALAIPTSVRNPGATDIGLNNVLSSLSNERLVGLRRDGRPDPALAERWEVSEDGLTWRLFLRPNLRFHDGTPLDAPHVAASLSPQVARGMPGAGVNAIRLIDADGPTTLVFHLRQPSSLLLDGLNAVSINSSAKPGQKPSPAGPFQLVSRQRDQVHLRSFTGHFLGRPSIDLVDVLVYPNARNAWSAMMRGEVDVLFEVAPEAVDFIVQSSNTQVKQTMRPYVYMMGMNMRHPILSRREVRLALNQAVNRTKIIEGVFRGQGYPAGSHVWPYHWAYDHLQPRFRFLPEEATRLLDAAGLPWKPMEKGRTDQRFSFVCLVPEGDLRYERIGLTLQQQLIDIGVDMQLQAVPPLDLVKRLGKGDYDAVLIDLISTPGLNFVYNVWHSPTNGPVYLFDSGYTAADAALDRLQTARTDDETRAAVREVQKILHDDPPAIFICWSERARAVNNRFLLPTQAGRDIFGTLPQWRLAPPRAAASTAP